MSAADVKGATTGGNLEVYVHFDGAAKAAGSVVANTLGALRDKIKEKFSDDTRKFPAPDKLIVQIKVAENKFLPLDNDPKLKLDGAVPCVGADYDVYVEVPEVPKAGKSFAKDGVPPLADRCGSTSDASVNEGHEAATTKQGIFNILKDIKLEGGRRLWATYEQDEELAWGTEKSIQEYVKALLMDAIASVGLKGKVKCFEELSVFDLRPDIWVVLANGVPIGVVEVKVPSAGILNNPKVHGQIFDYMLRLQSFFGVQDVFGLVSTYESSRIFWFPQSADCAKATELVEHESKGSSDLDLDLSQLFILEPPKEEVKALKKGTPKRNLECSPIIPFNHPEFPKIIGTMIKKMFHSIYTRKKVRLIDSDRPYLWINELGWEWHTLTFPKDFRLRHEKLPTAASLILLRDLGHGADGRVWQACSANGLGCAIKFPLKDKPSALDEEFKHWEKLAPKKARLLTLGGRQALMMPFVHSLEKAEWTADHQAAVSEVLANCVAKGLEHKDLKPRHVGFRTPKKDGKIRAMLIDLARMEDVPPNNPDAKARMETALL